MSSVLDKFFFSPPATLSTSSIHGPLERLRLTDGFGTASDSITVRALAKPATPTGFSATAGDQQVTLAWVSINETYSDWQYRQDSAAWTDIEDSHGYTTSHTVTDLTNGTEYAFKIRAINANEPGESSEVKRATPKPKDSRQNNLSNLVVGLVRWT